MCVDVNSSRGGWYDSSCRGVSECESTLLTSNTLTHKDIHTRTHSKAQAKLYMPLIALVIVLSAMSYIECGRGGWGVCVCVFEIDRERKRERVPVRLYGDALTTFMSVQCLRCWCICAMLAWVWGAISMCLCGGVCWEHFADSSGPFNLLHLFRKQLLWHCNLELTLLARRTV